MNGGGKSDGPVVSAKRSNNVGDAAAQVVEGRGPAKGNTDSKPRPVRRDGTDVSHALARVREAARGDRVLPDGELCHLAADLVSYRQTEVV